MTIALPIASPPPRHVPWRAQISMLNRFHSQIGAFVLFITLFLAFISFAGYEPDLALLKEDSPRVAGHVEEVIINPGTRGQRATRYDYQYSYVVDGAIYRGEAYADNPDVTQVTVQYAAERPDVSRIDGMEKYGFSDGVYWAPLPFFLITLYLYLRALQETIKDVRLVRDGVLVTATVARTRNKKGDDVALLFMTNEGQAWQCRPMGDNSKLKNGERKTIVYVPGRPKETMMHDRLDPLQKALLDQP